MFTVKHVTADGEERIFECDSFSRDRRQDGFWQYMAHKPIGGGVDYIASWCGDERVMLDEALSSEVLYVMNRHGSTVASYRFKKPDFNLAREQADPDLVAVARSAQAA